MRQCPESYLRHIIRWPISRANKPTLKAIASYGPVRDQAIDALVDQIVARMKDWEILIPEPAENIFQDLTDVQREELGLKPGATDGRF